MKAERTFLLPDLLAFAELSGDYNPLHTDPVAARRTQFGECVTHGVFVLLWALDALQSSTNSCRRWTTLNAKFLRPVVSGSTVTAVALAKSPDRFVITVSEQGRTLLQCELAWAESGTPRSAAAVINALPPREVPQSPAVASLLETSHCLDLYWSEEQGKRLFPALAATQSPASLAALLASTRVIGMKVPGEHSIFLQLDLCFSPTDGPTRSFAYHISEFRKSSQRLSVAVEGSDCHGLLWALVRPAPVNQPSMQVIRGRVPASRFAGRRVVVLGGSRGLGEVAAKILAAGGAEVAVSYRVGHKDAQRVVEDILAQEGKAFAFRLDTASNAWDQEFAKYCSAFDHLCFFATPPIVGGDGVTFSETLFQKFNDVYVYSLLRVAQRLAGQTQGAFALFNASSIYVAEPPLRNLEYAASKAASEACCFWLRTAYPKSRIHIARFPRLSTDQTASFISASESDTVEVLYQELASWFGS